MIIQNGCVQFLTPVEGLVEGPYLMPAVREVAGEAIPCQFQVSRMDSLAASSATDSPHTVRSYSILVDGRDVPLGGRLRLTDMGGGVIGDFGIISVERLNEVGLVRYTV